MDKKQAEAWRCYTYLKNELQSGCIKRKILALLKNNYQITYTTTYLCHETTPWKIGTTFGASFTFLYNLQATRWS